MHTPLSTYRPVQKLAVIRNTGSLWSVKRAKMMQGTFDDKEERTWQLGKVSCLKIIECMSLRKLATGIMTTMNISSTCLFAVVLEKLIMHSMHLDGPSKATSPVCVSQCFHDNV